jgi:hypothetical protein
MAYSDSQSDGELCSLEADNRNDTPRKTFPRGISSRAQCTTPYEIARGAADDGGWIGKRELRMKINIASSTGLPSP